jgi:DNA replication protein DnaC
LEKLRSLRLSGMLQALQEQTQLPEIEALSFEERLGLLVDREATERENRRLRTRLNKAKLRQSACLEDIDFQAVRGLDRALVLRLGTCQWIESKYNVLITGPTGVGKSYLGCALAHKACLTGYSAYYERLPRLLEALHVAKADGRYGKMLVRLSKVDVLVLDDWGLVKLSPGQQHDLLEVIDDRHDQRSTIVTSQLAVEHWHETMADPTLADAILDRLIHAAYRLNLQGASMRKVRAELLESEQMS